jgi:undecaprenyl-diphosphatase
MTVLQSIILGLIQGLGEFLPISSSGHLVLTPWLFGWEDPGLTFSVALHLGTFFAAAFYFRRDLVVIIRQGLNQIPLFIKPVRRSLDEGEETRRIEKINKKKLESSQVPNYPPHLLWLLVLATIPGGLAGFFLDNLAEDAFRNPLLIAGALSILGFLLFWIDKVAAKKESLGKVTAGQALLIGVAQACAIVPGVSRSGATITAARALQIDRASAARFSFLLSLPIILGASIFKLDDFLAQSFGLTEWLGVAAAALSGYLAIAGLIKFIQKSSYAVFFWYRLALAVLIVFLWLGQG